MRMLALISLLALYAAAADQYVYVRAGAVACQPRDLPSVGVRLDTGDVVLGLHGADSALCAACGWYRVRPHTSKLAPGQYIAGRTYQVGKDAVQEVVTLGQTVTQTPAQRIAAVLDSIPAATDDERVSALIRAVATSVTGKLDKACTISVPAKAEAVKK